MKKNDPKMQKKKKGKIKVLLLKFLLYELNCVLGSWKALSKITRKKDAFYIEIRSLFMIITVTVAPVKCSLLKLKLINNFLKR